MSRLIEELSREEMQDIVQDILEKKDGSNNKQWADIVANYDLDCSAEALRRLGAGVIFASKAGMRFNTADEHMDKGYVERQKMYDIQRKIRQDMREFSRTELICEHITKAIESLPKLIVSDKYITKRNLNPNRDLVVGIGDFHYGAEFEVKGLYGETINKYNSSIFEQRMETLMDEIVDIVDKENPGQLTIMIVGDMLDGLLRTSQLQRLEYGVIQSTMKLGEVLSYWFVGLGNKINIPIRVYAVRGNHGEIRPLGTKAGQFPEENMERIVMHYLYARFKNEDWITIATDDAPMLQMVDICGYQILLTHGQGSNIKNMAKDYVSLYNKPIDMFMIGHLHKSQSFVSGIMPETNIYVERVPSLCGTDPYAQGAGYSALPGAIVILMEEGYGRRCVYPIVLP